MTTTIHQKRASPLFLAAVHLKLVAIMVVGPMVIPDMGKHFNLSTIEVKGWVTALLLGTGLVAFGAGAVSEALGRRIVGVIASVLVTIAAITSAIGWNYWIILAMAVVLGAFISIIDINMDGYVGSVSKGRKASGMFSHIQMFSDLSTAVLAFIFGMLAVMYSDTWRWFFIFMAALNITTLFFTVREFPTETVNKEAFRNFLRDFREGLRLLRNPAFLCIVGTAMFGSSIVAAVVTDGPTALRIQANASGWVYGGTFGLLAIMGSIGYLIGIAISKRKNPTTQLVVGTAAMLVTGIWMILAVIFWPGNTIALGIPMAVSFGGHTIVSGAALAAAVDIAQVKPSEGASMLTLFKRLVPLLLSVLLVVLTILKINNGPMSMSIAVFTCSLLGLICAVLSIRLKVDPVDAK